MNQDGTYVLRLSASDQAGNSSHADISVVWDAVAPTVSLGADLIKASSFTLTPTVTNATTFQWSKVSGPGNVTFSSPQTKDTDVSADVDGVYVIRLTVTDAEGSSASDELSFDWQTTPPSVNAGSDVCAGVNSQKLLNATTTGAATYEWTRTAGPGQCTIASPNAEDTQVSCDTQGSHTFNLKVKNALNVEANDSLVLDVKGSGDIDCAGVVALPQPNGAMSGGLDTLRQPDGKLVVVGVGVVGGIDSYHLLYRLNADGSLDTSFGTNGMAYNPSSATKFEGLTQAARASNGKFYFSSTYNNAKFVLVAFNADGSLDTSYGTGGRFEFDFSTQPQESAFTIQNDNKIVFAGNYLRGVGFDSDTGVMRWEAASTTPDTTFGTNGFFNISEGKTTRPDRVKILSDGKILILGRTRGFSNEGLMHITRLTASGALDTSFNNTGTLLFFPAGYDGSYNRIADAAVLSNGKIVLSGIAANSISGLNYVFLGRLNDDGSWDNSFGSNGQIVTSIETYASDLGVQLVVQNDGKLLIASASPTMEASITRFNSDGTLDTSFANNGVRVISGLYGSLPNISVDGNGDIFVTGPMIVGSDMQTGLVKIFK